MKAYNISYHASIVDRKYAESSWQAIDAYASNHPECCRKHIIAIPATKAQKAKPNNKKTKTA